jgi:hypothetical protein
VNPFVAIILIYLNTIPRDSCNETTAADVLSNGVENELACVLGGRMSLPAPPFAREIGKTAYLKTLCRHRRAEAAQPASPR